MLPILIVIASLLYNDLGSVSGSSRNGKGRIGRLLNPDPKSIKDPTTDPKTRSLRPEVVVPKETLDRAGEVEKISFWPNGTVYYQINSSLPSSAVTVLDEAIADLEAYTCIRFMLNDGSHKDYVTFYKGSSGQCDSNQGMIGGEQTTSLGEGCQHKGIILHELLHVLGLQHEHNRCDRNDFVKLNWTNIVSGARINFAKQDCDLVPTGGVDYDYSSIMHYSGLSWAIDKAYPTIVANDIEAQEVMGQREGLTEFDVEKVKSIYDCRGPVVNTPATTHPPATATITQTKPITQGQQLATEPSNQHHPPEVNSALRAPPPYWGGPPALHKPQEQQQQGGY